MIAVPIQLQCVMGCRVCLLNFQAKFVTSINQFQLDEDKTLTIAPANCFSLASNLRPNLPISLEQQYE
jgi:hypothetical protein